MSWKAMEVSMSKTRRGKYIDNRICHKGKCKGDMRFNLLGKGKLPCFSYLCEGNHFRFIEERYKKSSEDAMVFLPLDFIFPVCRENGMVVNHCHLVINDRSFSVIKKKQFRSFSPIV